MYQFRFYRFWTKNSDLVSYSVSVGETDLLIRSPKKLSSKAEKSVLKYRKLLIEYIGNNPEFMRSMKPVEPRGNPPEIVKDMLAAGRKADVGPMAAVAGAIAERVGNDLLESTGEIIIENGGDIFLKLSRPRKIGIYAGETKFSNKLAIEVEPGQTPMGICTSSATVGHSLSMGKADAVVILSRSAALADAVATAACNRVKKEDDIPLAIEFAKNIPNVTGGVIIIRDRMAAWGDVKLAE